MSAAGSPQPVRAPAAAGRRAIVFVGFMGAGKSTAARAAASELGVAPLDSDAELERRLGERIEAFFDREGEAAFRAVEEEVVLGLLGRPDASVISLGGGALGSERVRAALAEHLVVHVEVSAETAWRRASGRGRPLARDRDAFAALYERRRGTYEEVADVALPQSERGTAARVLPALAALERAPAGTRVEWAPAQSGGYPVFIGRGLIAAGFRHPSEGRGFAISDANVVRSLALGAEHVLEPGETTKTLAQAEAVLRAMARAGLTREDHVVAIGGGVVGDLAGFCAAVYQRGIDHVQVPTTLVAQVDSAYGGKTGVDLPEGKNYVGAYRQPAAVIVDPAALETLPAAERAAGYAEVVKTALIAGGELWLRVRTGAEPDDDVIRRCLRTKIAIVAEDERDAGARQLLNLGHTVAHAVEAATGYARYRHGEAVAIGLLCALRLSGQDELRREVAELLVARGLPTTFDGADPAAVVELVRRDKKRRGSTVPFVLVEAPGKVSAGHVVAERDLRAAVEEAHGA